MAANFAKLPDLLQRLKAMTQTTPKPPLATYVAALGYPTGNAFSPFDSITYEAASEAEAKEKANEWANKNYGQVDARTWLQVKTLEGRGIYNKQLGKF
jgi:hypothetical protein